MHIKKMVTYSALFSLFFCAAQKSFRTGKKRALLTLHHSSSSKIQVRAFFLLIGRNYILITGLEFYTCPLDKTFITFLVEPFRIDEGEMYVSHHVTLGEVFFTF